MHRYAITSERNANDMPATTDPQQRAATAPDGDTDRPVTLINSFVVAPGRDDVFVSMWTEASRYFRAQPGFVSLRFHRAVSPDADYRYVNVARWETLRDFQAAHETEEFRRIVSAEKWKEFPASPALYEVIVVADADEPRS
jgi:heme-degrading monooxygenase HmoA